MIRSPRTLVFALLAAAFAAPAAFAQPLVLVQTVSVSYGDLDLSKPAGVTSLMSRIDGAARRACGDRPLATDRFARTQFAACFDAAVSRAVADVSNPDLTALLTARDAMATQYAGR